MSARAVTVRLQRLSQLRALCLSLAAAGRRAGLAPHPAGATPEPEAGQHGVDASDGRYTSSAILLSGSTSINSNTLPSGSRPYTARKSSRGGA